MGRASRPGSVGGLRVVIAGGGVAGLEAMLAIRDLGGDLVDVELLSPEHHFWYRPLSVAEPFGLATRTASSSPASPQQPARHSRPERSSPSIPIGTSRT